MSEIFSSDRRLSVNAAFMKDIKDDNRELKRLLDTINPLIEHTKKAANHWDEIANHLSDLRDQLAFHFSLEEAYGYFDEAIETEPQMSVRAEALRSEHSVLFDQICKLVESCSDLDSDDDDQISKAIDRFKDFQTKFQRHEEAELKMILSAMDDDLGVGG